MRRLAVAVMSTLSGAGVLLTYHSTLPPAGPAMASNVTNATSTSRATGTTPATGRTHVTGKTHATGKAPATATGKTPATGKAPAISTTAAISTAPAVSTSVAPSGTFTGSQAQTQWGIVQVQIVMVNGKITSSEALLHPSGNGNSDSINAFALPQLRTETLAANSARISAISGATVTSGGYVQSLQSAIDLSHR